MLHQRKISNTISVKVGVKPGCVLFPLLFVTTIDYFLTCHKYLVNRDTMESKLKILITPMAYVFNPTPIKT